MEAFIPGGGLKCTPVSPKVGSGKSSMPRARMHAAALS